MTPFAQALADYHSGIQDAAFTIHRDDGFHQHVPAAAFFDKERFPSIELRALDECRGQVLDIGSAVGRHSLELKSRGMEVTSLEILPELEVIMRERGLHNVVIADVFEFSGRRFDTLLMLMNGIGMTGNLEGLHRFLVHAHSLVLPGGSIICDSIDVSISTDPQHIAYRERNIKSGRPAGQQFFEMTCDGSSSARFDWLHIDFDSLEKACAAAEWHAEKITCEKDGRYLCRITEKI
ncbi:MAG: class I SAM-dependent methyltransferase [Akkermansiaceae bacterium]